MGEVYAVYDTERGLRLALKHLSSVEPHAIARFKNEFRVLRDIQHHNLVSLGDLVEERGQWFFTMELVEGIDFLSRVRPDAPETRHRDRLSRGARVRLARGSDMSGGAEPSARTPELTTLDTHPLDPVAVGVQCRARESSVPPLPDQPEAPRFHERRLRDAFRQLAAGLSALHRAGKVHRDLKPSNIMVTRRGRVVVLDFGVAAELERVAEDVGLLVGTVAYMAPEQSRGEPATTASDWYAVGTLLFQALTGRLPFDGSPQVRIVAKRFTDAPPPSQFVADLPPDLERLCVRLLAREPAARPGPSEILQVFGVERAPETWNASPGDSRDRFVGRQRELGVLRDAFAEVRAGASATVVVQGASGVGKTSIVEQYLSGLQAETNEVLVLRGRCHEREAVPFKAFDGIVDDLSDFLRMLRSRMCQRLLPEGAHELAAVFPAFARVPEIAEHGRVGEEFRSPQEVRDDAFLALRELLRRLARWRPLVLVIDDLQRADSDSIALLERLTRTASRPKCLLILIERVAPDRPPVSETVGGVSRHLALDGLPDADALALARSLLRGHATASMLRRITSDARGHPLFIRELVRYVGERELAQAPLLQLEEVLCDRVDRLGAGARLLVEYVVASGGPVPQGAVADAARLSPDEFSEQVAVLRRANLVRSDGSRRQDAIEPYHDRVREAVYTRIPASRRAAIHGELAARLEDAGAIPDVLAAHFELAGAPVQAAFYAEAAGFRAVRLFAFDRAAQMFRRASHLIEHPPDKWQELRVAEGEALINAGRPGDAARVFLVAADAANQDSGESLDLNRRAAEQFLMGGYLDEGLEATRRVLAAVGSRFPETTVGTVVPLFWAHSRLRLRRLRWRPRVEEQADGARTAAMDVLWSVSAGLSMVDAPRGALFATRGPLLCMRGGDSFRIARSLSAAAVAESSQGNAPQAIRLIAASKRAADEDGSSLAQVYPKLARAVHTFLCDNNWPAAYAQTVQLAELWKQSGRGAGWEADVAEQIACWSLDNIGDLPRLRGRVVNRIEAARRSGNRFMEVGFRTYFYSLYVMADEPDQGAAEIEAAIASWLPGSDTFGNQHYWAARSLAFLSLYRGDIEEAECSLSSTWHRLDHSLLRRIPIIRAESSFVRGALAIARAALARRREQAGQAKSHLRRARRALRRLDRTMLPARVGVRAQLAAGIAAVEGDLDGALACLQEAEACPASVQSKLNAEAIRWRIGRLLGGSDGAEREAEAVRRLRNLQVVEPRRLIAALTPGFDTD